MLDPFARNRLPKIPDGSVTESHGRQHRSTAAFSMVANTIYDFMLFPGLGTGFCWRLAGQTWSGVGTTTGGFLQHTGVFGALNLTPNAGALANTVTDNNNINKWRYVSGGVKLKLLNNDNQNDGWWEAVRIAKTATDNDMSLVRPGFATPVVATAYTDLYLLPDMDKYPTSLQFANDPSYSCGRLKDINKTKFLLPRADNHMSWIDAHKEISITQAAIAGNSIPIASGTNSPSLLQQTYYDPSFQCVLIRVYAGVNGSQLLIEYASNVELVYDESSSFQSFMTASRATPSSAKAASETTFRQGMCFL